MAEGGPPDCETQKNEIGNFINTQLVKGDTWYLLDSKWFKQWKKYVGYESWDSSTAGTQTAHPGPIDNSTLFKDTTSQLKEHLIDELDYVLLPDEGWKKLVTWYSTIEGQESIARKVIEQGMFVKHCKVEVYLMELKLCMTADLEKQITKAFSRADTIEYVEKYMKTLFEISETKEVRLWNRYMANTYEHLSKPENTLQDSGLFPGQIIVMEEKNEDGTWQRQAKSSSSYSTTTRSSGFSGSSTGESTYSSYGSNYDASRSSAAPGLCGLGNLGNTCFMNSAIQCMSNVPSLTEYFLIDRWSSELNEDNPLGMKGEIAISYAELVQTMWSGRYSYTVPRNFKVAVGKFAPQFSGYQQHDSQELMAFLLDGLHEDLNRIKKKPYIELKDSDGEPDEALAKYAWDNYLKRNDSIIVDTFHGLLKSTLVCPDCSKISVTFDPFCYLSLPLPIKKERSLEVFWVPLDPAKKTVQYKLTVPKLGIITNLCESLSKQVNIPPDMMVVTDVYNHRFHKVFSSDEGISHIMDRDDIFIYEVPVSSADDPATIVIPIYMREKKCTNISSYQSASTQLFGSPLLLPVPRKGCTYDMLYQLLLQRMARLIHVPETNDWWNEELANRKQATNGEMDTTNGDEDDNGEGEGHDEQGNKTSNAICANEDESTSSAVNGNDSMIENVNELNPKRRLFKFTMVNSYGSVDIDFRIRDDDKALKLSSRTYISLDWFPLAKSKFYDDKAEMVEIHDSMRMKSQQKKQVIQLNECLDLFTTNEKLGVDDPWYCPRCKRHQQASKKFDLWSLSDILVIHLKRFSYNRYWRDKIDCFVEFPTRGLSLKKYIINPGHGPTLYDLIGVCNHYGGLGAGHYTAYGKNKDDGEWYSFDDSSVSQTTADSVVTKAAYVLVYQRRGLVSAEPKKKGMPTATITSAAYKAGPELGDTNGHAISDDEMDTS